MRLRHVGERERFVRWLIFTLLAAAAGAAVYAMTQPQPLEPPAVFSPAAQVDAHRCAECHSTLYEEFQKAPHRFTLRPGNDSELIERFRGQSIDLFNDTYQFDKVQGMLQVSAKAFPGRRSVDWIFGSGHHALTPVTLLENPRGETEMFQFHASWYPDHGLGLTPGSMAQGETASIGLHHSATETLQCFGCHSTFLAVENGQLDLNRSVVGVTCARCHPGAARHADSEGELPTAVDWKALSPLDSINRCGECHRRIEEFTQDELTTENQLLIRFAPVGLALSPCFQSQAEASRSVRMDCITCHDPHRPAATDPAYYAQRCNTCHAPSQADSTPCPVRPQGSDCLTCHMPKVKTSDYLAFTDHWIRVREPEKAKAFHAVPSK